MNELLNSSKTRVKLLEDGIQVDKNLPKWKNAESRKVRDVEDIHEEKLVKKEDSHFLLDNDTMASDWYTPEEKYTLSDDLDVDKIAKAGVQELNDLILKFELHKTIQGFVRPVRNNFALSNGSLSDQRVSVSNYGEPKKKSWWSGLLGRKHEEWDKEKEPKEPAPEIDVLQFFDMVKLSSKESVQTYKDRVAQYLVQLHKAIEIGQTNVVEQLVKGIVTNKYEAVLAASGYYYAIEESQIVEFAKKSGKGISMCYLRNFSRVLPDKVSSKIIDLNQLEIFDNYVVLYYDPQGKIYKETRQEEFRRKSDPILFGLIAGSGRLYFVDDWIDEYCDLTLDKLMDTLGKNRNDLII